MNMKRYKYEVCDGGSCLRESEYEYESEDEARQEAEEQIQDMIDYWKMEETYDSEKIEDFDIRITEKEIEVGKIGG